MSFDLDRFRRAQESDFPRALAELQAGRKRSHWIWYVFPQLRGLGSSPMAVQYGLESVAEAEAFARDPLLGSRLLQAATAARDHLRVGVALEDLMGSEIDATKLVSSMTLFEAAARDAAPDLAAIATEILAAAERQGRPRCEFTLRKTR